MIQPPLLPKRMSSVWVKALLMMWMFLVVFIYLLLFGPPEFWLFAQRLGIVDLLYAWELWLQPFFTADYLA